MRPVAASGYSPFGPTPRPAMPVSYSSAAPGHPSYGQPMYTSQPRPVGMPSQPTPSTTMLRPGAAPTYTYPPVAQPMPTTYVQGQPMPGYAPRPVMAGPPYQPAQTVSSRTATSQVNSAAGPGYTVAAYGKKHHDDAQLPPSATAAEVAGRDVTVVRIDDEWCRGKTFSKSESSAPRYKVITKKSYCVVLRHDGTCSYEYHYKLEDDLQGLDEHQDDYFSGTWTISGDGMKLDMQGTMSNVKEDFKRGTADGPTTTMSFTKDDLSSWEVKDT